MLVKQPLKALVPISLHSIGEYLGVQIEILMLLGLLSVELIFNIFKTQQLSTLVLAWGVGVTNKQNTYTYNFGTSFNQVFNVSGQPVNEGHFGLSVGNITLTSCTACYRDSTSTKTNVPFHIVIIGI